MMRPTEIPPATAARDTSSNSDVLQSSRLRKSEMLKGFVDLFSIEFFSFADGVPDREPDRTVNLSQLPAQLLEALIREIWVVELQADGRECPVLMLLNFHLRELQRRLCLYLHCDGLP